MLPVRFGLRLDDAQVAPGSMRCLPRVWAHRKPLVRLLRRYGIRLRIGRANGPIAYTHWGSPEAGIKRTSLYIRPDTPVHSALHEACHIICAEPRRRRLMKRDAGGCIVEENAVNALSIMLGAEIDRYGPYRHIRDMRRWGYSFRLGSARRWFERDSSDALQWLWQQRLIRNGHWIKPETQTRQRVPSSKQARPLWRLRSAFVREPRCR